MKNLLIIVPLFNEYGIIKNTIKKLKKITNESANLVVSYYKGELTPQRLKILEELEGVEKVGNKENGRGAMITNAYFMFKDSYSYFMYIDVDFPFEEEGVEKLIKELVRGDYDIVAGSKHRAKIRADLLRKILSKSYYLISNFILFGRNRGIDFQTGVKAWKKGIIEELFPNNNFDKHWFFDTELLYYALKRGKKIKFIGINSEIGKISTVRLRKDVPYFLKKLEELKSREKQL